MKQTCVAAGKLVNIKQSYIIYISAQTMPISLFITSSSYHDAMCNALTANHLTWLANQNSLLEEEIFVVIN